MRAALLALLVLSVVAPSASAQSVTGGCRVWVIRADGTSEIRHVQIDDVYDFRTYGDVASVTGPNSAVVVAGGRWEMIFCTYRPPEPVPAVMEVPEP